MFHVGVILWFDLLRDIVYWYLNYREYRNKIGADVRTDMSSA